MDRQVIGILKPTLSAEFGWTELNYSWVVFSFQTAYAIGLFFVGNLMDKIGTKKGFSLSVSLWSIAAMAHAWAVPIGVVALSAVVWILSLVGYTRSAITLSASLMGFIVVRFLLGLGEAGNFPASIKTVAGGTLVAKSAGGKVTVTDEKGGVATVTIADVYQSNGVIHVVDKVLLPK